ncbi:hypothetical protein GCM10009773_07870 [Williamsia serinedens]
MTGHDVRVGTSVGTPTVGGWCDTCNLPSGISWPLYAITPRGVLSLGTYDTCADCES